MAHSATAASCGLTPPQTLYRCGQNGASCPPPRPVPFTGQEHRQISGRRAQITHQTAAAKEALTYKQAGVDINAGAELVRRIKKLNPAVGGFSGLFPFGKRPSLQLLESQSQSSAILSVFDMPDSEALSAGSAWRLHISVLSACLQNHIPAAPI